jgi:lipopolysaccharide export system protein LptA
MTIRRHALKRPCLALAAAASMAAFCASPATVIAQTPNNFASSYSANAGKPVDIEADTLEVDDKKKTAVFRGNVSATQGSVNMKSKEIYVTYAAGEKKTASAGDEPVAPSASGSPLGGSGQIKQIDAKGNVFLTMKPSKEGEKQQEAKSDWAIFDVKKQQITIGGDVVLSQGENVIRGSKLVIDLTTGLSRFENSGKTGGTERMRAIFTPPPKFEEKLNGKGLGGLNLKGLTGKAEKKPEADAKN